MAPAWPPHLNPVVIDPILKLREKGSELSLQISQVGLCSKVMSFTVLVVCGDNCIMHHNGTACILECIIAGIKCINRGSWSICASSGRVAHPSFLPLPGRKILLTCDGPNTAFPFDGECLVPYVMTVG